MKSELAIVTKGLGKAYRLGEGHDLALNFREAVMGRVRGLARRSTGSSAREAKPDDRFWALRDLDLEVKRGEVVGILGRNGAGKSTLLKLLSRITAPTTGSATIRGRVGSLLEVGTGFHLELTGRENIFLNGAILGMRRREILSRFDEIVDFAEIGPHIDTPVKRYSSGMRMRLGFAVAAFLDTEILFVDEVLAVGDAEFRRKCLGKMGSIANEGRTVLFVSHNMSAISNLCSRAILIDEGRCVESGEPRALIQSYLDRSAAESQQIAEGVFDLAQRTNPYGRRDLILRKLELLDAQMRPKTRFEIGEKIFLRVHVEGMSDVRGTTIGLIVKDEQDRWICDINTYMSCAGIKEPRSHREVATLELDRIPLVPGSYPLALSISTGGANGRRDFIECATRLEVIDSDIYGSGVSLGKSKGVTYLEGRWRIEGADDPGEAEEDDQLEGELTPSG